MKKRVKHIVLKTLEYASWGVIVYTLLMVLYHGSRVFLWDQFIIPTQSMEPTLIPGDRIVVNKLIFGGRIYKSLDFDKDTPMESWRMSGFRKIKPNDVVVFNYAYGYGGHKIAFEINFVYAKRCIGTPGDSVSIVNGFYRNNRFGGDLGYIPAERQLASMPDSLIDDGLLHTIPFDKKNYGWTIKNMGPLYVPRAGGRVALDSISCKLYKDLIEFETGEPLEVTDQGVALGGRPAGDYVFKGNYYFMCGDNVFNSQDGRYVGFVPEEFIVGVAKFISYSRDRSTGKFRWGRFCEKIK